jgi:excisionase family DNA binding protein
LTAGTETKQSQPGEAETPTTGQRKPVSTTHGRKMIMDRKSVRPTEAARLLGVSRETVYVLMRSGQLRSVRLGRARLIPVAALDELLSSQDVA